MKWSHCGWMPRGGSCAINGKPNNAGLLQSCEKAELAAWVPRVDVDVITTGRQLPITPFMSPLVPTRGCAREHRAHQKRTSIQSIGPIFFGSYDTKECLFASMVLCPPLPY